MLQRLPPSDTIGSNETTQSFDLRAAINFLWRKWKFISALVALSLLVGAVYLVSQVPRYTANTQILIDPQKERAAGRDAILSELPLDVEAMASQIAIIQSPSLLHRVAEKEHLGNDPEFGSAPATERRSLWGSLSALIWGSPSAEEQSPAKPQNQANPAEVINATYALMSALSVTRSGQSYVLSISLTSTDPIRAARLANAVADAYTVDKLDARFDAARRASAWLSDRLEELRKQLRDSEQAVVQFRADHGVLQPTSNLTLNQQQLSDLNARLITARGETAEKKARLDLLNASDGKNSVKTLPDLMNSGSIAGLRSQLNGVSQKEADLTARYGDHHPLVVNVRAERADVERAIATEIQRLNATVKNEYELAKAREAAIDQSLKDVTGQSGIDSETAITMRELERTAAVNKTMFEDFLQRAKITQEQTTFEARDARVIATALPPADPSAPKKGRVMGTALIVGLLLGVGGAFAAEMLNAGFTSSRQVEELLEVPLLASISRLGKSDLTIDDKLQPLSLYPILKPLSRYSEAIRTLRSSIQMTDVDNPPKVIQVTSMMPGEGKTTIALSLATSAAGSGLRVLLVDADLRHPSATRLVGYEKQKGLVEYLVGAVELKEVITFSDQMKFWTLPAGGKTQNPPDLLGSERMKSLVANLKKSFDYIVIDSPPLEPVIDAAVVAQVADKIVFVVRWAVTAREMIQRGIQRLSGHKKVAGVAFNLVNENLAQKYVKYGRAGYGNAYDKYYTD
jgi:succinoglycan biosynthesis transport protein ExoP